jgi:hypothetical protein
MMTLRAAAFLFLVLGPPPATASDAAEGHDYRICKGYYALCSASTCTPTRRTIRVNVTGGGTATFPEAVCNCPIFYGLARADVTGGNMRGSCEAPGPSQIWSLYAPKAEIPQAINNWAQSGLAAAAPLQICPASLNVGNELANCFSFSCDSETYVNGVPVATCYCPLGETFVGTSIPATTAFTTQVGQANRQFCFQHPVSVPIQ